MRALVRGGGVFPRPPRTCLPSQQEGPSPEAPSIWGTASTLRLQVVLRTLDVSGAINSI